VLCCVFVLFDLFGMLLVCHPCSLRKTAKVRFRSQAKSLLSGVVSPANNNKS